MTSTVLEREAAALAQIAAEPFVRGLADGAVPDAAIDAWLREDRYFVRRLRRSIGLLIASAEDERTVELAAGAFPAIQAELDRFDAEIARRGVRVDAAIDPRTVAFSDRLDALLGAGPAPALAAYWAAEHAYWWAWSRARAEVGVSGPYADWIDNWSSPAFAAFVVELADLVDATVELDVVGPIAREVFAEERGLWRRLWDAGA